MTELVADSLDNLALDGKQEEQHGHSHGGAPCHGHGAAPPAAEQHGHSHGGAPCHGHGEADGGVVLAPEKVVAVFAQLVKGVRAAGEHMKDPMNMKAVREENPGISDDALTEMLANEFAASIPGLEEKAFADHGVNEEDVQRAVVANKGSAAIAEKLQELDDAFNVVDGEEDFDDEAGGDHGHSHGGKPCHGHGAPPQIELPAEVTVDLVATVMESTVSTIAGYAATLLESLKLEEPDLDAASPAFRQLFMQKYQEHAMKTQAEVIDASLGSMAAGLQCEATDLLQSALQAFQTDPAMAGPFRARMQKFQGLQMMQVQELQDLGMIPKQPEGGGHGHSHGGKPCHGHGEADGDEDDSEEEDEVPETAEQHGHSHGGAPCHGHGN